MGLCQSLPKEPPKPKEEEGLHIFGTGPMNVLPCGVMKADEEIKNLYRLQGGKFNQMWCLYFFEKDQAWYLCQSVGDRDGSNLLKMLEEGADLKEHTSCYRHEESVPLNEGEWVMTWMGHKYSAPDIVVGWKGEDKMGVNALGTYPIIDDHETHTSEEAGAYFHCMSG
jgi:hypothetical protein